ncbi:MAG TPA: protein translocase subunit SecF [Methanoregulaceae archaeon]|jgi:preprotein translocase subunit SecF|nr:protein translocase subunit SecF [Methanolinea sp.]MCC7566682.1 protein translocase subunit SecF [Methanoregulaceae archaeon]MDD3091585.1 protein translocase subunit SecF [Methanoregulaceae archaeon]MDD5049523.1 protein translocase subunit SecF [Methanoregulaceae archaeon]MDD5685144.1 protein translocase subunit SecF [Methanoregulaceae archaeon]
MGFTGYDVNKYSPKQMIAIPMILLLLALAVLGYTMATTGMPVKPGMDFSGGTAVTLFTADSAQEIGDVFSEFPLLSIGEGLSNGKYLKFGPMDDESLQSLATLIGEKYPEAKIDQIGATFGETLQQQAFIAVLFSFIGMTIVVFLAFRTIIPAGAVVLSAFADIAMTGAVMNIIGIDLSLPTTAALLMLIGYSVDSDILLTMRVLKRKGKLEEKLAGAFRTGIIMTTTTLAAIIAMWGVAFVGQITVIWEIATVLIIGLVIDMMNTWLTNAGIIKWYVTSRGGR